MWDKPGPALRIHCNSQSLLTQALNTIYYCKLRHIRWQHKIIRQLISSGVIYVDYIKSVRNLADPFTKGLSKDYILKSSKWLNSLPVTKDDWWNPTNQTWDPKKLVQRKNKIWWKNWNLTISQECNSALVNI